LTFKSQPEPSKKFRIPFSLFYSSFKELRPIQHLSFGTSPLYHIKKSVRKTAP
jgi:hypothetical protein